MPCSRCSTAGPTCSRFRASGRPARRRRPTPSPARAGPASCPPASPSTSRRPGMVWILGRIYCTGTPEDYKAVHALQDKISVVPLSAYGKPYTPRRRGRSGHRHEDRRARAGQCARCGGVLQAFRRTAQGQSGGCRGCPGAGKARQDRCRSRSGFRRRETRPRRGQGSCRGAEAGPGSDHGLDEGRHRRGRLQARARLAVHDEDRPVRHELPSSAR
jgi:hypothetical protein